MPHLQAINSQFIPSLQCLYIGVLVCCQQCLITRYSIQQLRGSTVFPQGSTASDKSLGTRLANGRSYSQSQCGVHSSSSPGCPQLFLEEGVRETVCHGSHLVSAHWQGFHRGGGGGGGGGGSLSVSACWVMSRSWHYMYSHARSQVRSNDCWKLLLHWTTGDCSWNHRTYFCVHISLPR